MPRLTVDKLGEGILHINTQNLPVRGSILIMSTNIRSNLE